MLAGQWTKPLAGKTSICANWGGNLKHLPWTGAGEEKLFKAPRQKTLRAMAHKSTASAKNEAAIKNSGCKILNPSQKSDKRCVFWHNVDNFFFAKINHLIAEKLITATLSAIEPKRVLGACSSPFGIALGWSLG